MDHSRDSKTALGSNLKHLVEWLGCKDNWVLTLGFGTDELPFTRLSRLTFQFVMGDGICSK